MPGGYDIENASLYVEPEPDGDVNIWGVWTVHYSEDGFSKFYKGIFTEGGNWPDFSGIEYKSAKINGSPADISEGSTDDIPDIEDIQKQQDEKNRAVQKKGLLLLLSR